ncbi:hypothetical protein DFH29DRAFT_886020 [Suillus ampliporus]|nr:hypothetical protein DFH29DRAFT_886020 [Suillus ampliporus]
MRSTLQVSSRLNIKIDTLLAVISPATKVGNIRPSHSQLESVAKIHEVYCLTSLPLMVWFSCIGHPKIHLSIQITSIHS